MVFDIEDSIYKNMILTKDPTFGEFLLRVGNEYEPTIGDNLILLPKKFNVKH